MNGNIGSMIDALITADSAEKLKNGSSSDLNNEMKQEVGD
jgi:hypothetical protein